MDNSTPQSLSLNLQFSFNDVRRAAALCGMSDISDENIKRIFFNPDKRLDADIKTLTGGQSFDLCVGMVGIMIGLHAIENNDENLINEVTENNVIIDKSTTPEAKSKWQQKLEEIAKKDQ